MSLLTYLDLCEVVDKGWVQNALPENIGPASIDLRIGTELWLEASSTSGVIDLAAKQGPRMEKWPLSGEQSWMLYPGDFALISTLETFNLPNHLAGRFMLKSTPGRCGLGVTNVGWVDPGFSGSTLTVPLRNDLRYHPMKLRPGTPFVQLVLWSGREVPEEMSYTVRGSYNEKLGVALAGQKA